MSSRLVLGAVLATAVGACGAEIRDPSDPMLGEAAPDSFSVVFETSAGDFVMKLHREWSPVGVDRIYHLAGMNFYGGARIYRVNGQYAQFGFSGRPEVDSVWIGATIPDEPPRESNVRGSVSFARGGADSRSVILFINQVDNTNLDDIEWRGVTGFPPVGRVEQGMDVVGSLYSGYGDEPMQWEDSISASGNTFLSERYPQLDSIIAVRVVDEWR